MALLLQVLDVARAVAHDLALFYVDCHSICSCSVYEFVGEVLKFINAATRVLEVGRRRGRQRKCWMDKIKEWTSLATPELLTRASSRRDWMRMTRLLKICFSVLRPCLRPARYSSSSFSSLALSRLKITRSMISLEWLIRLMIR